MKKLLLGLTGSLALFAGNAAQAADLPVKAPAMAPAYVAPVSNWTGFYLGINGGYGWNNNTGDLFCVTPAPGSVVAGPGCSPSIASTLKPQGGLFGGQAGFNYQSGIVVWGIETDIQWSDIKNSATTVVPCCLPGLASTPGTATTSQKLDWFGTFRGRLGIVAGANALLYVTGGLIYGEEKTAFQLAFPAVPYGPVAASSTRTGWTIGGGLEYMFTRNLSGKIEGLYYDMGSQTLAFTSPLTNFTEGATFAYKGAIIRGGLNWKFDWGGPVVASY